MGFGYFISFSDHKYLNLDLIWIQKLRVFYRYFNYRPEPIRTQEEPTRTRTENSQVPIYWVQMSKIQKTFGLDPTRRPELPGLLKVIIL